MDTDTRRPPLGNKRGGSYIIHKLPSGAKLTHWDAYPLAHRYVDRHGDGYTNLGTEPYVCDICDTDTHSDRATLADSD